MSLFSFEWFKFNKEVEEKVEKLEKELNSLESKILKPVSVAPEKLYKKVKLVNEVLTVVLQDNSVLSKPNATMDDFTAIRNATSEGEILEVIVDSPTVVAQIKEDQAQIDRVMNIHKGFSVLDKFKDFKVEGDSVYLEGTGRTMPEMLINEFLEIIGSYGDEEVDRIEEQLTKNVKYNGLKYFFIWCCLNPRAEVADQLYSFLKKNSFRITKQGFFVALRNVVKIKTVENGGTDDISNFYNKVKAVWKKKPSNFEVFKNEKDEYVISDKRVDYDVHVGNLAELYKTLPSRVDNRYTDAYTQTFDIRVGQVVNMPPEKCSWSTADCAEAGLHFTSDEIHYVGCGDTSMLILINPMKVVGIGEKKGRCYEYLPIMTVPRVEATVLLHDLDFDTLELDEEYAIRELQDLENKVKAGFTAETTKYQFNLPGISSSQITRLVSSLSEIKNIISKRVTTIK